MKKLLIPIIVLMLVLAACGNKSDDGSGKSGKAETKSYTLDSGKRSTFLKILKNRSGRTYIRWWIKILRG